MMCIAHPELTELLVYIKSLSFRPHMSCERASVALCCEVLVGSRSFSHQRTPSASALSVMCRLSSVFCQNIIKKVSGQKFVYKFVSQPDPSLPDGVRNGEEGQRRDSADPNSQSKGLGGVASACPSKGLPQVYLCLCFEAFCDVNVM